MKVAILGYVTEGGVSYDYFTAQGHDVTICDQNPSLQVPAGAKAVLGEHYLDNLDRFDLLVRTASLPPRIILERNPTVANKVTSQVNEFFKVSPTKNIIGITGTKGKGTTSTLVAKMLEAAGKKVKLAGNIGIPALQILPELAAESWVVLELSSYQLSDLKLSPPLAACLMVIPEHLDWHLTFKNYLHAKQQLFRWQTKHDTAVYYAQNGNSKQIVSVSPAQKIPYFAPPGALVDGDEIKIADQTICHVNELKLIGKHNWQNVCAAITIVWQITQDTDAIRKVLTSFSGLPYRIEFRKEVGGVRYYNDSFASGPGATLAALQAIPEPKVVIMGGYDRGLDLVEFADDVRKLASGIRKVIIIGASGERLAENFERQAFKNYQLLDAKTMPEIVRQATSLAHPGDAVLLSPAFASFDMFKNFEERGKAFNEAVEAL